MGLIQNRFDYFSNRCLTISENDLVIMLHGSIKLKKIIWYIWLNPRKQWLLWWSGFCKGLYWFQRVFTSQRKVLFGER